MTRTDFASVMAYLCSATGLEMPREQAEVYYDLLQDLPLDVLQLAVKRVILEHPWRTIPSVAEIRQAAADTMQSQISQLSAEEAWGLAWKAAAKTDPEQDGSLQRATKGLPPLVVEAMRAFGLPNLITSRPAFARPEFMKTYEALAGRKRRLALLPEKLKAQIVNVHVGKMTAPVAKILEDVGREP